MTLRNKCLCREGEIKYFPPRHCFIKGKKIEGDEMFRMESEWQEQKHINSQHEKSFYGSFIGTVSLPQEEIPFVENPFYFSDLSKGRENNGYGDHSLYGLYAGWPQVLMVDKQGYFTQRRDFLGKAVERNLSHKNSLLSAASMTQIIARITKEAPQVELLKSLRPKDPGVRKEMLEREGMHRTEKRDHNQEALNPYVASINFPHQFPLKMDESSPFPHSLKREERRQRRERIRIAPDTKKLTLIPKIPRNVNPEKTPQTKKQIETRKSYIAQSERTIFHDIADEVVREKRSEIDHLKKTKRDFLDSKRIELIRYQDRFFQEPDTMRNLKTFYDPLPKVETPHLAKMIKNGMFTRKYYLDQFGQRHLSPKSSKLSVFVKSSKRSLINKPR